MTASRAVPLFGLAFIVCALLMLGTIISRSPYTHANLLPALPADYDRTGVATIGEADLQAIRAELEELPRPAKEAPGDRRLAVNTVRLQTPGNPENMERYGLGKALFTQKCTGCHSIGGGRRVGPDLKAITGQRARDWLIQFVLAPDRVIASGDPIATLLAKAYVVPMPNLGLARPQAEALLAYIEGKSADRSAQQAVTTSAGGAMPAQQDGSSGKGLFEQKCASCHSIGAGKLVGPDLKGVSARRSGDWVIQFIVAPDRLIAGGDATAAQLVKEYGVPMPNLGVAIDQAEEILAHIDVQSGMAPAPAARPGAAPSPTPAPTATVEASPTTQPKQELGSPAPTTEDSKPSPTATRQATPVPPVKAEATPSPTATAEVRATPAAQEERTPSPPPPAGVSFAKDVLPVFQGSCVACHGTMGGFAANSYATVMNSGDHKPIVVPGDPDGSLIVQKLKGTQTIGQSMPMGGGSLPADTIQKIVEWIRAGAKDN